jgi:hypothetical protein
MFRRLAETFQNGGSHDDYINAQNRRFTSLPNMIPSGTSGLRGFDSAIQSVDPLGQGYQRQVVKYPNDIFIQDTSPNLNQIAKQCANSSLDDLIAAKNTDAPIGCGWLYTPPTQGSPYPKLSQGFIGDSIGPLNNYSPPDYKKWFFDLQLAKKQVLMDKCKALKACTDVDSDVFNGVCGYCTDTNQGVPIDSTGQPLYGGDPLGNCSPQSIIASGSNCPPPPGSTPGDGPQPIIDRTCDSINGRLSATCLYQKLLTAGCSDNGSLAIALANPASASDYLGGVRDSLAVKVYNRVANPPLNLDIFASGAATMDTVLSQARQLVGNTTNPPNSALGASARDLCLQTGAINNYDFCNDLVDSTGPPFDIGCLQKIFLKLGGQPSGLSYPQAGNINVYNSMGTLGGVKQYMNGLVQNMSSSDYSTQRNAMLQFLGIQPEKLIKRAPYNQGVEVIWMLAVPGNINQVQGILKRTIERDIVNMPPTPNPIPQLQDLYPGFTQYGAMIQMFDLRAPQDFSVNFNAVWDDGMFIAVNQPANVATTCFNNSPIDQPGLFSYLTWMDSVPTSSQTCTNYMASTPNITKMFLSDATGGWHAFQFGANACSGQPAFSSPYYSLTCEPKAPFLNFEVLSDGGTYDDIRNPGLISNLITTRGLDFHNRSEERNSVPGKKGFIRFTNNSTYINHINIAYQSWKTVTFAFRLQSMPVDDALFAFWVNTYSCIIYLQPINGNTAQMKVRTNMTRDGSVYDDNMVFKLQLGQWYLLTASQSGQGLDIYCDTINNIINNNNYTTGGDSILTNGQLYTSTNFGLYMPGQLSCNVVVGGSASGTNKASAAFQFDLAWTHFFDYYISPADAVRECKADWTFTQFPDSPNTYKTLG